jgi:Ca2+-transporting ATPase
MDESSAAAVGLSSEEARERLAKHGPNEIPERAPISIVRRVVAQFANPLVYVLLAALALEVGLWIAHGAKGVPLEPIAIAALLALNAGLGAAQEAKADRALAGLRKLSAGFVGAIRDGVVREIPSREIVPGDLVRLEHGDRIPADGTLVRSAGVAVDESITTGESLPIEKAPGDGVTSGTLTVRGNGLILVAKTGKDSATGVLAATLNEVVTDRTPLEKRLRKLGDRLAWAMAALVLGLAIVGVIASGFSVFLHMLVFGAALAVAAVPEGLPAAATLTLALGVKRMAARHAIVRKLSAVETLGSVSVVATDKTGTLTENHIQVREVVAQPEREDALLCAMTIANEASKGQEDGSLDAALLASATARGADVDLLRATPRVSNRPFDSAWKFMRVSVESDGGAVKSWLKGAPEIILARSELAPEARAALENETLRHAAGGYRVLAFACGAGEAEEGLEFLGFTLLQDPPRAEAAPAIATAQRAGVRVIMMTGDHPETARAIARQVGIDDRRVVTGAEIDSLEPDAAAALVAEVDVFARVRPEHKLMLVDALKKRGEIVAMTGDGVNDAPALKRSDVGIAMGKRGSDVARDVADIVLADDNFASIVAAIEEGRNAYENIQTFIRFTLASNLGLVLVTLAGALAALFSGVDASVVVLPLTALQLLWINFLGDGPPALALVLDRDPSVMTRPPRRASEGAFDRQSLKYIGLVGLVKGAFGAIVWFVAPIAGFSAAVAQTGLFLFESIGKLVSVLPARISGRARPTATRGPRPRPNWTLTVVFAAGVGLQVATLTVAPLRGVLGLEALTLVAVGLVALVTGIDAVCAWVLARVTRAVPVQVRSAPTSSP